SSTCGAGCARAGPRSRPGATMTPAPTRPACSAPPHHADGDRGADVLHRGGRVRRSAGDLQPDGHAAGGPGADHDHHPPRGAGLFPGSRITPTVTAGQTYFIVVDGYAGAQGTFSLTVTPPGDAAPTTTTTLPGGGACSSPAAIPAQGGTMSGATSGASALAGSCGSSETSPERVYQWTPAVSGTATIQTCGAGTSFDTVLYLRSGVCASGPEMAA